MITLELLADLSIKNEFRHPVYASHCCNLAFLNQEKLDELIEKLLIANISIVSLPTCNLFLQGRNMSPVPRGVAPLKQLLAAGVNVCVGSDNVHDPFNPFGSYDLLKSLHIACLAAQIGTPDELFHATNLVIRNPARALGDPNHSVCVGNDANLFITDKSTISECVIDTPKRLACFHKGKLVFQQSINETLIDV